MSEPPSVAVKPEFATNSRSGTVADAITAHLSYISETWAKAFELAIATAYFNVEGFHLLADELERVDKVRLLLGVPPDSAPRKLRHLDPDTPPERAERARVRNALAGHARTIAEDRDLLGFELEIDARVRRLVEWLRSGRVEVRRFEAGFLHGKAFLVATDDEGVIAGSSNFTHAGLARNRELNLGHYQPAVVGQVRSWFDEMWEQSQTFDLAAIYAERFEPHNPYLIYLRMLKERYGRELEEEASDLGTGIHLTQFQQDGVWRAKRILRERGGVVIADGVGLGKTFIAGELIREAVQERRQRALLVAPAALRDGPWRHFLLRHSLGVECVSFEELSRDRQLNADGNASTLAFRLDDYAMVVIDEAHGYRNPDTHRAAALRRLLPGHPRRDVVFITATPVNNSLWDLYYLLSYFLPNDGAFSDVGIRSMRDHFAEAMALDPDDLAADRLFDILDAVAVRRTRHFVKRYYPNDRLNIGGVEVPITFPDPYVRKVVYDLDDAMPGFFERFAHALDCADGDCQHSRAIKASPVLSLARYAPSRYALSGAPESHELQLAGLLRSGLLKRFESSAHAFGLTCERMAKGHDGFLQLLDRGYVATADALADWIATDSDELGELDGELAARMESATNFDTERLRDDVEADRDLLRAFAQEAASVAPAADPKLRALLKELGTIAEEAANEAIGQDDERDRRKTIVFSYYADTVDWIQAFLVASSDDEPGLRSFRNRIVSIAGGGGDRSEVLFGFAPRSTDAPTGANDDRYDVLVTTDILAEGVNLQQARHIVNYDLPWNPMRLVQRHGRIDRIGSGHEKVWMRCFFPDRQLDALLGLEERLHRKIAQAAASVGVESEVLPGSAVADLAFAETREELERLRAEDNELFVGAGERGDAYSGEEYRQELRAGLQDPQLARLVAGLPWGSGSGKAVPGGPPGFVFCARVGDHPAAQYRYVAMEPEGRFAVTEDTLSSLARAHATAATERALDGRMHELAYEAWAAARTDIFDAWQAATDPRNLQPEVPKTMRDAAALLREYPPSDIPQGEIDTLIDAVEAPYAVRIQRLIRNAMQTQGTPQERAREVAAAVKELGLEPAPSPEPLPVISVNDVHLVCWMALIPQ